jgi:hypothetical protein
MTEPTDNPFHDMIASILDKKREAIDAHTDVRSSDAFNAAATRTDRLIGDYAFALNAISVMATRCEALRDARLSLRMHDLFLESAVSTGALLREGMLNPARREMRFLLEASIKAWWCDGQAPGGAVASKVDFLDDLGAARFREVVETLNVRLIDASTASQLLQMATNLYSRLSTHVHASKTAVGAELRRFAKGKYIGFENVADVNAANDLFAEVLDVSLAAVFESFDHALLGDVFVGIFDDHTKWAFHRTPLVKAISAHFDYKAERRR